MRTRYMNNEFTYGIVSKHLLRRAQGTLRASRRSWQLLKKLPANRKRTEREDNRYWRRRYPRC